MSIIFFHIEHNKKVHRHKQYFPKILCLPLYNECAMKISFRHDQNQARYTEVFLYEDKNLTDRSHINYGLHIISEALVNEINDDPHYMLVNNCDRYMYMYLSSYF